MISGEGVVLSSFGLDMQVPRNKLSHLRLRPNRSPMSHSRHVKKSLANKKKSRDPSPSEMSVEPWPSPQDQAAAEHTPSPHDQDQDQDQEQHPDKLCLDSFWSEVETIRQGSGYVDLDSCRRDSRQSDDGEQEEQWLADAGLSTLISEDSEDVDKAMLLSTLTRTQAEAVQRRLDSYTLSLRKRNKPAPRDVRDIFNSPISQTLVPESQHGDELAQNSMASVTKTPLSEHRKHPKGSLKEEIFITDMAYCEQAAIFLKQAKLPQNNTHRRKEDSALPRVICPKCRLGVTCIHDLSHSDMKKVRQLALIDMTALCDLLELEVKRHKTSKRKMPDSPLFGVPLATLLENDQKVKTSATTPLFLQALLSFLEKKGVDSEGILRVPGSQSRIKILQQKMESNFYSGEVSWDNVIPNDAAALLKKFIRELPAPLLTAEYLSIFSAVRDITELKQKLHMLNLLILLLPEPNRNTLKALLEFLSKVVSREKRNRMNLWAVSTIMAPNLFLHKAVPSRLTEGTEKGQAEKAADVMRLLIRYQDLLWTVPNFLMNQVRKLNENSSRRYQFYDRHIKNLLRKIHTDSRDKPEKNTSEPRRTVKVQVGDLVSSSMEFQVNVNSQASDLLAQFHRQFLGTLENGKGKVRRNGSVAYSDCAIYEVGGNIGEHCLDPDTHLLDLYNINPSGEWVIKLKPNTSRGS
ncbi:rho GTPase-activating protein 40 isoform X2 [Thalassophryne amazonica]|uniref:rho GTPase-activating protein 40 isoform X2 n=1 Tax=Thalassophryne amazonica TaxID=390379 RepID=UPI0014715E57|nr:rho GTPase-activating protein 40 isoform X2 [Thalassophryne amazonica]